MSIFVCGGNYIYRQEFGRCPGACGITDSALVRSEGSPYYGPIWHCSNCGDTCSEGELGYRPFRRGWRQESIAQAVADWDAACACPVERDADYYPIPCEHDTSRSGIRAVETVSPL